MVGEYRPWARIHQTILKNILYLFLQDWQIRM